MYIQDTNTLENIAVSEALFKELVAMDGISQISDGFNLRFDSNGRLSNVWSKGKLNEVA